MIDSFHNEYAFLSNFFPCVVIMDNKVYRSVEHAYQAAKTNDPVARQMIRMSATAAAAKRLGRKVLLRDDWDEAERLIVMHDLLEQKFSDPHLSAKLVETHPQELVEGNWWGDTFWGVCRGQGENMLGELLMEIREELIK